MPTKDIEPCSPEGGVTDVTSLQRIQDMLKAITVHLKDPFDSSSIGTGFIVSEDGLIVTCSHVILDEQAQKSGAPIPARTKVVFTASGTEGLAEVVGKWWFPVTEGDIAVLKLVEPACLPTGVKVAAVSLGKVNAGTHFDTYGYPHGNPLFGSGIIQATVANPIFKKVSIHQLELEKDVGKGHSGSPIMDSETQLIVGMIVAVNPYDAENRLGENAYGTEINDILRLCKDLPISDSSVSATILNQPQSYENLHSNYLKTQKKFEQDNNFDSYIDGVKSFLNSLVNQLSNLGFSGGVADEIISCKTSFSINLRQYQEYKRDKELNLATASQADSEKYLQNVLTRIQLLDNKLLGESRPTRKAAPEIRSEPAPTQSKIVEQESKLSGRAERKKDSGSNLALIEVFELKQQVTKCSSKVTDLSMQLEVICKRKSNKQFFEMSLKDNENFVKRLCDEFIEMKILFEQSVEGKKVIADPSLKFALIYVDIDQFQDKFQHKRIDFLSNSLQYNISPNVKAIDLYLNHLKDSIIYSGGS